MLTASLKRQADAREATVQIADWVATQPVSRTLAVEDLARDGLRDLVGCMIAGSVEPTARKTAAFARQWGCGGTTIVGSSRTTSVMASAFANATAAHALDFDDSFAPITGHPSAPLIPALLALAEERNSSGSSMLDAYVCGLEVMAAIGLMVNPSHYLGGWHSTATIGVIGAAAACSRLLGLDKDGVAAAISIAVSSSSGSRMQLGFPMKSVHAGLAARDAVAAALMAAGGIFGNPNALGGKRGFVSLYSKSDPSGKGLYLPSENDALAIVSPGITFKPYPTCGSTHRSLDALLELRKAHGFRPEAVKSIELEIPAVNVNNLIYSNPTSGMEGRFSMHYCAALAVAEGALLLSDFEDDAIFRPHLRTLMPRVEMRTLPGTEKSKKDYLELPAHTTITLKTGEVLANTRYGRRGSREEPMSRSEHTAKFLDCAGRLYSPATSQDLLGIIAEMKTTTDMQQLMAILRSGDESENTF